MTTDAIKAKPSAPLETVDVAEANPEDSRYFSVTTILKAIPSSALEYWAIKMAAEAAVDSPDLVNLMLKDQGRNEAVKWLIGARYRRPKITLGADQLGTCVHKVCEKYQLDGERPGRDWIEGLVMSHAAPTVDVEKEIVVVTAMVDQFDSWCQRFQPTPLAAEMSVYSDTYRYAGTLDSIMDVGGVKFLTDFKGLDVSTPIATPTGWTTIGALQIGDKIFGTDGTPVNVTAKSEVHLNQCYRVTFDDTTSIVCDDEHLWPVISTYDSQRKSLKPGPHRTDEIARSVRHSVAKQRHWIIPLAEPLQLPEVDLPIDPYVYGCWLGDGERNGGSICKPDEELFDLIRARGYHVGEPQGVEREGRCRSRTVFGLMTQLKSAGLFGHRVIPSSYLRASISQRLDLLRGLMDTDGTWNRVRNQAVFCTVDKHTAETVYELVTSLGERPLISTVKQHGFGKWVTAYWVVWFPRLNNPFALSRKADLVKCKQGRSWRRMIKSVEPTVAVPTQCITVDAKDSCYLAGNQMVATHNTRREPLDGRGNEQRPYADTALQLAAYRHAELAPIVPARRTEEFRRRYYLLSPEERATCAKVPEVDRAMVLLITPQSCEAWPMRCDEEVFKYFLYCRENFRWLEQISKKVVAPHPLEPC